MEPQLIGLLKGQSMRRQVLCARRDITSLDRLRNAKVASAATEDYARTMLRKLLDRQPAVEPSVKILTVPKDLDALMAVGFGLADAALSAQDGLTQLASLNPKLAEQVHSMATTDPAPLPILAAPRGSADAVKDLVGVIEAMARDPEGGRRLNLIGLDGLRKLTEAERRMLL